MKLATVVLTLTSFFSFGQTDLQKLADSLKYVTDMPYICESGTGPGCGDPIFWNVVQQKRAIIPVLIELLSDTTTTPANVLLFGGQWTVADVAYNGLQEIIKDIPTFDLLGVKFDKRGCGYCAYWNYLRKDIKNRKKFQARVREWYNNNKTNLVWVVSDVFLTCECTGKHPNRGHFEVRL